MWNFAAFALDALAVAAQALVGTALGQADAAGARAPSSDSALVLPGGAGAVREHFGARLDGPDKAPG